MQGLEEADGRERRILAAVDEEYNRIMSKYRDMGLDFGIREKVLTRQLYQTREAVADMTKETRHTVKQIELQEEVHASQKAKTMKEVRDAEKRADNAYNAMEKVRKELAWFKKNNGLLPPD